MAKRTGPGRFHSENQDGITYYLLFNYDVDVAEMKPQHVAKLLVEVIPFIRRGDTLFLLGLASRTAGPAHNMRLSADRVKRVASFLKPHMLRRGARISLEWRGEVLMPGPDEREDDRFRAVALAVRQRPTPPPSRVRITLPPAPGADRDPITLGLQPVFMIAPVSGFDIRLPLAPPGFGNNLSGFNIVIWDVVHSRAAAYKGVGLDMRFSIPPNPFGGSIHLLGDFTAFTPGIFMPVTHFEGPFQLHRLRVNAFGINIADLTITAQRVTNQLEIHDFQMGPSIPPSAFHASTLQNGSLSLLIPGDFPYNGE
jgi:hypothetical protein